MPLDPRIALLGSVPQVQPVDYASVLMNAARIREARQQEQIRQLALTDALAQQAQQQQFEAYMRAALQSPQGQPAPTGLPSVPLSQIAPTLPGERPYPTMPAPQAPWAAASGLPSPAALDRVQTPPTTPYTRAPLSLQPPAVQATLTGQRPGVQEAATVTQGPGTFNVDWRKAWSLWPKGGLQVLNAMRDYEQGNTKALLSPLLDGVTVLRQTLGMIQDQPSLERIRGRLQQYSPDVAAMLPQTYSAEALQQLQSQLIPLADRLTLQTKILDDAGTILGLVSDQRSLDEARTTLRQYSPGLAGMLPETYSVEGMEQARQRLRTVQQRTARVGLTPVWGKDEHGNIVPMQTTETGHIVRSQLPPGVTPMLPARPLDVGTGFVQQPNYAGAPQTGFIPKDVRTPAREKAAGTEEGKFTGQQPAMARKAEAALAQLEQRHQLVEQDIARALALIRTSPWPTTGVFGDLSKAVPGTPAHNLSQLLSTITANIGFAELQLMRESSPTGGALGQVSDFENRMLQSVLGSLQQSQSTEQFTANLGRLQTFLAEAKDRRRQAYQRDFRQVGPSLPPERPPTSPYGHLPVDQLTPEQMDEEERWLKQHLGGR